MRLLLLNQSTPFITIAILFILIVFIVGYVYYIYKKEKQIQETEARVLGQYDNILLRAHNKAQQIVTNASEKAKRLLLRTHYLKENAQQEVDDSLKEETAAIQNSYKISLASIKDRAVANMQELSNSLKITTQEDLALFNKTLQEELVKTREQVAQQMKGELQQSREEIAEYKKQAYAKVDTEIKQVITLVCEQVIGKAIPISEHEKLIEDALMKAKGEGFFEV